MSRGTIVVLNCTFTLLVLIPHFLEKYLRELKVQFVRHKSSIFIFLFSFFYLAQDIVVVRMFWCVLSENRVA